ncbi:rhomboid family intramembrane serine protease [bacterium]|nr:MAG: rhomboid family intramembrane serine protease [bacterium]
MIPLKTLPDATTPPIFTRTLAVSIALVWLIQLGYLVFDASDLAARWGTRPACYFHPSSCGVQGAWLPSLGVAQIQHWGASALGHLVLSPLFSLWLHADWWHVGFNLLFLLVFGGAVENEIGRFKFLLLYFVGGMVATVCHIVFNPLSHLPTIGASGAIAAILGAHFWRLPRAWVLTYFPPIFVFPVPAPLFGILWLAAQFAGIWSDFRLPFSATVEGSNVAWTAHLGGFAWGAWTGWRSRKQRGAKIRPRSSSVPTSNVGK